jgi:hypothetical protein
MKKFIIVLPILMVTILLISSCSTSSETESSFDKSIKPKGEQTLHFTHKENEQTVDYEVIFRDDKIISLYLNGIKIPDSEIKGYEDIVYNKLNRMRKEINDDDVVFVFRLNSDEFKERMNEFREKFKDDEFKFRFDKEKFKADMDRLKEELKNKKIVINLDKEKMKKNMQKLREHLKELEFEKPEFDFDFDFDFDDLNDKMKKLKIKIMKKDNVHRIETEKLEKDMEKLKEEMGDLSIKMNDLEIELDKLDNFLTALKEELVKDNLINSVDDNLELEMSGDKMIVNEKEITGSLFSKYKNMYENHFDKKLEGNQKFQIK